MKNLAAYLLSHHRSDLSDVHILNCENVISGSVREWAIAQVKATAQWVGIDWKKFQDERKGKGT
jgi:hypothetical protein